jgi:succinate dehydrogenase flavin-adding protein (antitoxin of CptAB toxin-antitoxin module)
MYRLVVLDHVVGDFPEKDLAEYVVQELREYMDLVENVDYTIKEIVK